MASTPKIESEPRVLDHLAIHVADRAAATEELLAAFDVHVIERNERLTLIGADAQHGKITLLDAVDDAPPVPRELVSIVLAERAGSAVPPPVRLASGLVVTFGSVDDLGPDWSDVPRHALVGITLRVDDPTVSAARLAAQHGMHVTSARPDVAVLEVAGPGAGEGRITLMREHWDHEDGPGMLDHIGVRVLDAERWRAHALELDATVVRWIDAEHSRAVFVAGPEDLLIEFVEHTAPLGV